MKKNETLNGKKRIISNFISAKSFSLLFSFFVPFNISHNAHTKVSFVDRRKGEKRDFSFSSANEHDNDDCFTFAPKKRSFKMKVNTKKCGNYSEKKMSVGELLRVIDWHTSKRESEESHPKKKNYVKDGDVMSKQKMSE